MVTVHAVLQKRDERAVISWVGLAWLAPIIGSIVYAILGVNRIQRSAVAAGLKSAWTHTRAEPELTPEDEVRRERFIAQSPTLPGLAALGNQITGNRLLPGNKVEPLHHGDEAYPSMLAAIDGAERSVSLLSYIFDSDRAGDKFLEALVAAKKRGVEVRVLIDHVGARYSKPNMVPRLKAAGLRAESYRIQRLRYANLRNHRKILVVDGKIGFTGGTNIREGHWLSLKPEEPVQCMHFKIEGPVVGDMQEMFAMDWAFATGESLGDEPWFPKLGRSGSVSARGIPDGPDEDLDKLEQLILGAMASATRRVKIATPYFLPNQRLSGALTTTAMRGVEVDILLPSKNNIRIMDWAATPQLPYLIEKGCRIHTSPPPFDHTKLLVVDGLWSLIGSTNWDARSLRLNFEFNIECYDDELATNLEKTIDEKIRESHLLSAEDILNRPLPVRFRDGVARLLSPYL